MGSDELEELYEALGESQRLGFLGDRPIVDVVGHAQLFVGALDGLESVGGGQLSLIDLGSGGGVPGLVVAQSRPDVRITLLDRRTKRTDFLQRIVSRLGWGDRVKVVAGDALKFAADERGMFDGALARGFGPPASTLRVASTLIRAGGRVVISDPPGGDRWSVGLLDELGVERLPSDHRMAVFQGKLTE